MESKTNERIAIIVAGLVVITFMCLAFAGNSINARKDESVRKAKVAACATIKDPAALNTCLLSVDGVND